MGCVGALDANWYDAGNLSVACSGEIYNANDLCNQLGLAADAPVGRMLLAAWQRWSEGMLPRLDGLFALALRNGNELLLYRDPSGLRNLYYIGGSGQIAFATHLDTLRHLPVAELRLARRSLHEYLRFLDIAAPSTLFEDVHAVEAAQLVRFSASRVESRSWPVSDVALASTTTLAEAVEQLDATLRQSVQARLAGSYSPAAFLSGGVDSSLLCALAARQRGDVTALTVGFEGVPYDETPVAQRIASHLGMTHKVLRFSHGQYVSAFEELSEHLEQPMADPATAATLLAFHYCRSQFDTVLDGTGADEAVGAMPPRHVGLAVGYASLLPAGLRRALVRAMSAVPGLAGYTPIIDFEHPADTMIRWKGFTRTEVEELCSEPVSFEHTQFYRTFARFPRHAHYERYSALLNAMPNERLTQAALISGMSVRCPFSERDTDGFIRQLRTDWRYLPGQPKRILRALLARYVPREIWDVPKHSFDFPLHEFLAADDFALVRRYVDHGRWLDTGLLRADVVRRYGRQYMAGDRRLMFRVWALVVLGAWLEKHDELT